jgi:hypothetical protein
MKFLKELIKQLYVLITTIFTVAFFLEINNINNRYSVIEIIQLALIFTLGFGYCLLLTFDTPKRSL